MLSYRHAFHAGNHADVLKHLVLVHVLKALQRKPAALCYIDTHAGAGTYDLQADEATKTAEYEHGIARLWASTTGPAEVPAYLAAVRAVNPPSAGAPRHYPGSPLLAGALLRAGDRRVLIERHPADHALLARRLRAAPNCRVECDDGFARLKAFVPPREKRGLVLIDPAYELDHEYRAVVDCVADAHRRWATGTYLVWYPLLARPDAERLLKRFVATGIRRQWCVEFALRAPQTGSGLWGSGMLVINPPFQLDTQFAAVLPWLVRKLGSAPDAPTGAHWLVGE